MTNPYMKDSGWPYESGVCKQNENMPWQFYVDGKDGTTIYDATPEGLHDAVTNKIDMSYRDEDDEDAAITDQYKAEIVDAFLIAVADNAGTRNISCPNNVTA